jgi:hypothetical protein
MARGRAEVGPSEAADRRASPLSEPSGGSSAGSSGTASPSTPSEVSDSAKALWEGAAVIWEPTWVPPFGRSKRDRDGAGSGERMRRRAQGDTADPAGHVVPQAGWASARVSSAGWPANLGRSASEGKRAAKSRPLGRGGASGEGDRAMRQGSQEGRVVTRVDCTDKWRNTWLWEICQEPANRSPGSDESQAGTAPGERDQSQAYRDQGP